MKVFKLLNLIRSVSIVKQHRRGALQSLEPAAAVVTSGAAVVSPFFSFLGALVSFCLPSGSPLGPGDPAGSLLFLCLPKRAIIFEQLNSTLLHMKVSVRFES